MTAIPKTDSVPFSGFVRAGLLGVIVLAPTQYGFDLFRKTHLSLVDPLIGVTFIVWLAGVLRTGARGLFSGDLVVPILFVGLTALSLISSTNVPRSVAELLQWAEYFIAAFLLFKSALEDRTMRQWALNAFIGVAAVVILLGLSQYLSPAVTAFQVRATFGNSNVFGGFLALLLPLFFGLMLDARSREARIALWLIILAGFTVVLSGGAFLALAVSFAAMAITRGWKAFTGCAAAVLVGVFLLMPVLPRDNQETLRQSVMLFNDDGEVTRRYAEWQAAMEMIREHPVFGVGAGCYQDRIGSFYGLIPVPGGKAAQPDSQNLFLVLSASIGLPGLAAFLGILMGAMANAARGAVRLTADAKSGLAVGVFGSLLAFSIACLWSPLLVRGIGIPLAFVLALAAAVKKEAGPPGLPEK